MYVLKTHVPEEEPPSSILKDERDAYKKHVDDANETAYLTLATINYELQKQHENMAVFNMIEHLKILYQEQDRHAGLKVSKAPFLGKLAEGALACPHVLKVTEYVENLERLGFPLGKELVVDLILQSLLERLNQFFLNFNMNDMDKSLP